MEFSPRSLKYMQLTLGLLFALTVGLLTWHHYGMERVFELSVATNPIMQVGDDRGQGGASVGKLSNDGKSIVLDCTIARAITYPFCQVMFILGNGADGVDMSDYDYVTFDIVYKGPGVHKVRNMLMNFEHSVSRVDDWMSPKINEVEFDVPDRGIVTVPVNVYRTANWWIEQRKVPLSQTATNISNVVRIELLTGNSAAAGHHRLEIRAIRFHGKLISQSALLGLLVAAWIICAVAWPTYGALQTRLQLRASRQRLALMAEINKALQIEARELVGQAHTDPLTGALNRQGLRAAMMNTSSLLADPMSIIFVDLDHFKRINDQHGHEVGDAVLRDFANSVSGVIRCNDKLVRWGGEEFLIICPSTTADQGYQLATKLRVTLPLHRWPMGLHVTASFGVASLNPREDVGVVIKRADAALYKAKANGRDRVEVALEDEPIVDREKNPAAL